MTALSWPLWLQPSSVDFGLRRQTVQHQSQITSQVQAYEIGAELWRMNITLPPRPRADAGSLEAFFNQLVGGTQTVLAWHFGRPVPLGTMRGAPVLGANAAQFARALRLSGLTPVGSEPITLRAGDMLGVGGQLFQVAADAEADGGGGMTVQIVNRVRAALASGAAVTWNRPTSQFMVMESDGAFAHTVDTLAATSFTLMEVR